MADDNDQRDGTKWCTQCKAERPLADFQKHGKRRDGTDSYRSECKLHTHAYDNDRAHNNADRKASNVAKWANRRAKQYGAVGRLTRDDIKGLLDRTNGICPDCELPLGNDWSLDHYQPLKRSRDNTLSNARIVHKGCNAKKADRSQVAWWYQVATVYGRRHRDAPDGLEIGIQMALPLPTGATVTPLPVSNDRPAQRAA